MAPLNSLRQSTARAATVIVHLTVRAIPGALGGDDYAFVPAALPSSRTDRL
jgi:hypothetical protein